MSFTQHLRAVPRRRGTSARLAQCSGGISGHPLRWRPGVEVLEARQLLSVTTLDLHGDDHGHDDHGHHEGECLDGDWYAGPEVRPRSPGAPKGTVPAAGRPAAVADTAEVEPNNSAASATPVAVGLTNNAITGSITSGDFDYYSFTLAQRSGVFFDVDAREIGASNLDSQISVFEADGFGELAVNDDGDDFETFPLNDEADTPRNYDAALYADLDAGSYVVRVSASLEWDPGSTGAYVFKVRADSNYASSPPVFSSLPGAADTLFLDFDGHSANDAWGTYTIAPFDFNGNGSEWTPGERAAIENVWRVVAEDYAPFKLNVTTSYGGSYANGVAHRQVIGNSNGSEVGVTNALGVAFLDSYAEFGPEDNVAFTFANNFINAFAGEGAFGGSSGRIGAMAVEMGNTTSHEFGHALGLRHYGGSNVQLNGIMHTPDFGLSRERWKAGTTHSNEAPAEPQDDVALISSVTNTFGYRADDHGNTRAAATPMAFASGAYARPGVIEQVSDLDVFSFEASGATTLSVSMLEHVANLDVELRLYNAAGTLLGTSDSTSTIFASLTQTLASGTYYAEVRSDGGQGEIGQFNLTVNTTVPSTTGSISGKAFHDYDDDGTADAGEPGLNNVTVYLDANNNNVRENEETFVTTDAAGNYSFTGLAAGTYNVKQSPAPGFAVQTTWQVILAAGENAGGVNFDNVPTGAVAFVGTANADNYLLRRSADTTKYEILIGGVLAHVIPAAGVTSLAFNLGGGNDALTVDHVNGAPMPSGGLRYDGGGLAAVDTDSLTVNGAAGADAVHLVNLTLNDLAGKIALHRADGAQTVDTVTVNGGAGNDTLTMGQVVFAPVHFNGGADADAFNFSAAGGNDTVSVATASVSGGGNSATFSTLESLTVLALAGTDTINAAVGPGGPATVTLDGAGEADTFNVTPSAATVFRVIGGAPTTAPGDTLNLTLAGATQSGLGASSEAGFQEVRFSNRQPVRYREVETLGSGIDATAPTADVADVTPDPRTTAVASVDVVFSEPVTGLDLADLALRRNGGPNLLTGAETLTASPDNRTFTLGGLSALTGRAGTYVLALTAAGSGVADAAGNPLAANAADNWEANATVAGRRVFYNNSFFDTPTAANPGFNDDTAIATDKVALLPGGTATFANYTSYSRGLNGVMVDVSGLADTAGLVAADFLLAAGNDNAPGAWAAAPAPAGVTVRPGAGAGGSDRVTLTWADGAIAKRWLQVTVLPTGRTGLAAADVFYFGNAVAESGNTTANAQVNSTDEIGARNNPRTFSNRAPVDFRWDYNRDSLVNSTDQILARNNGTNLQTDLNLISVPAARPDDGGGGGTVAAQRSGSSEPLYVGDHTSAASLLSSAKPLRASDLESLQR